MIYGAYGYTGELIAEAAASAGLRPVLAGRDAGRLAALAERLGLPWRAFPLENEAVLDTEIGQMHCVLNCAGPFIHTFGPLTEACIRKGVHYMDITGELAVFEALQQKNARAAAAGVMLLPGAGFDVVPTDCIAAHLQRQMPDATRLLLAFKGLGGGVSQGTARTAFLGLTEPGMVRRNGRLQAEPVGKRRLVVDFNGEKNLCISIPWGDVSTAWHSTHIPDIEVYVAVPEKVLPWLRMLPLLRRIAGWGAVKKLAAGYISRLPAGPSPAQRAAGHSNVWGAVYNAAGKSRSASLRCADGYSLTVQASLHFVTKALKGEVSPGFQTPSSAYGADVVMELPGVRRRDE